jgi:hypothetical protein
MDAAGRAAGGVDTGRMAVRLSSRARDALAITLTTRIIREAVATCLLETCSIEQ